MSDTIATEIGLLSNSRPRLITDLKNVVVQGTSGAISALGEIAGLVSAVGLGGLGVLLNVVSGSHFESAYAFLAVVVGAFLAMNFDQLAGGDCPGKKQVQGLRKGNREPQTSRRAHDFRKRYPVLG